MAVIVSIFCHTEHCVRITEFIHIVFKMTLGGTVTLHFTDEKLRPHELQESLETHT